MSEGLSILKLDSSAVVNSAKSCVIASIFYCIVTLRKGPAGPAAQPALQESRTPALWLCKVHTLSHRVTDAANYFSHRSTLGSVTECHCHHRDLRGLPCGHSVFAFLAWRLANHDRFAGHKLLFWTAIFVRRFTAEMCLPESARQCQTSGLQLA